MGGEWEPGGSRLRSRAAVAPPLDVWLSALLLFAALGVALPLMIVTNAKTTSGTGYPILVLWGISLLTAARLAEFLIRRRAELLRLAFYVFCYVFVGLSALAQVSVGQFPLSGRTLQPDVVAGASTLILVGLLGHEVGYLLGGRRGSAQLMVARADLPSRRLPVTVHDRIVQLLCVIGILVSAAAVSSAGISPFFTSREAVGFATFGGDAGGQFFNVDDKAIGLLWSRIYHMVPFVALLVLLHVMRRDASKRRAGYVILASTLAVGNVIVNNPIGNSRLWAGMVALGFLSVFIDLRRPRVVFFTALGMLGSFLVVFPFADAFRRTDSAGFVLGDPFEALINDGSFSAFQTTANGVVYVNENGLTWGGQLAGGLLTLFPRALWPGKPVDTGNLIDPVGNRAATFWTEMHINFGLAGAVVGFLLLGVVARRLDDSFIIGRSWALVVVPVLAPFYFILLRGTLSAAVGIILPLGVLLWLATAIKPGIQHPRRAPAIRSESADPTEAPVRAEPPEAQGTMTRG